MSTVDKAEAFISKFRWNQIPDIPKEELQEFCREPIETLPHNVLIEVLFNLSFLVLNDGSPGEISRSTIDRVLGKDTATRDDVIDRLIGKLQPLLLRSDVPRKVKTPGLRPSVGFSFKADENRRKWKQNGGLKSIPLFYVILLHLGHHKLSSNLWWITPGILNLLDDSSDLDGIKLRGVLLLRTFLESAFKDETRWISFQDTGLFELYEPLLINMCYYLPPVHSAEVSMRVWKQVFPTLNALYSIQFDQDLKSYRRHLGSLMSELVLQQLIPRINMTSEVLAVFVLKTLKDQIQRLEEATLYYLSRIIYTLGEYVVKDPFITTFEEIFKEAVDTLEVLISVCPPDRIAAHKYDFLALTVIMFDKCKQEGKLTDVLIEKLRAVLQLLEVKGCDFTDDRKELNETRDIEDLLRRD